MCTLLLIGVATAETLDEISLIGRRPGSAVGRIYQEMRSCIILCSMDNLFKQTETIALKIYISSG